MSEEKKLNELEENKTPERVQTEEKKVSKKKKRCSFSSFLDGVKNVFVTIGKWFVRMFTGASKSLAADDKKSKAKNKKGKDDDNKLQVEEIVSPTRQAVRSFFRRPLAVAAFVIVVGMFLFVFIGPLCMPTYSDSQTSTLHKNLPPNMSMMKIPKELKNNGIKEISSNSYFSVGLSNNGNVYVWGVTKMPLTKMDFKAMPSAVKNSKVVRVAAGSDHIVAITEDGKVHCWGNNRLGQYVKDEADLEEQNKNDGILVMPEIIRTGTLNVDDIKKVVCGTQITAILMNDGTLYIWGNAKTYELTKFSGSRKFSDIAFTLTEVVGVSYDGTRVISGRDSFENLKYSLDDKSSAAQSNILEGRKIVSLAATKASICVLLEDGKLLFGGSIESNFSVKKPVYNKFTSISGGMLHYVAVGADGKVYAWGDNTFKQCDIKQTGATKAIGCSYQTYTLSNGKVVDSTGLKGYLFGTDGSGSDVFKRIISGGKMTLTIGAVAVIISTIIGIIVGCISGYFGGWVDMLLMRITEIVAAIPFLPFAMILSAVLTKTAMPENQRIALIMVILGVLSWTGLARLVRGQVLAARENEYVTAARAMGVRDTKIAFKHILPNVISVIIVTLTLDFAGCMLTESSLSYLGFGVQAPRPTWGNMLNNTASTLAKVGNYWWQWLFPGLFLAITTICINIIGDTLRDVLDPKSSQDR